MKNKVTKKALKELTTDIQYTELVLTEVSEHPDSWTLGTDHGLLDVDKGAVTFKPEVGMYARFYGRGMGYKIRGVVIPQPEENIIFYYRTEKEAEEDHQQWIREENEKKEAHYKKREKEYDEVYASLPECYQKRIDRFRQNNPDFNRDYLEYQLFCDTETMKIAKKLKTVEQIDNFRQMAWDAQRMIVNIDEGHSGNTFEYSVLMAKIYIQNPNNIIKSHGSLCNLVGCKNYGHVIE